MPCFYMKTLNDIKHDVHFPLLFVSHLPQKFKIHVFEFKPVHVVSRLALVLYFKFGRLE